MIKHLHSKNTPSNSSRIKKTDSKASFHQILKEASEDLLKPREQAVLAILAKAALIK